MATIKKACKGALYPKSSSVSKRLGSPSKAKNGKSFPDLTGDGKVTKADILKGRGVIAKQGMKVKKAQDGWRQHPKNKQKQNSRMEVESSIRSRKPLPSGGKQLPTKKKSTPAKSVGPSKPAGFDSFMNKGYGSKLKKGGTMKKCAYGCK